MSGAGVLAPQLVGRDRELGWVGRLLREAGTGVSAALVVIGEAGVGKTALLRAAGERAEVPVLSVTGIERGGAPAYSGLVELCGPVRSHMRDIPPGQAGLLATALGWAPAGPEPIGPLGVGSALLSLLGAAATRRGGASTVGLLVIVDDADFLDDASREALVFAARRLRGEGVVILLGARPDGSAWAELGDLEVMQLGGLDGCAARALLAAATGAPVSEMVAEQLVASSAGNPLALSEMAKELSPDQLSGHQPLPRLPPVGQRLRDYFVERVSALPDGSRRALVVAAASFGNLGVLSRALEDLGLSPIELHWIEDGGLVSSSGPELIFRHPLARCAIYHSASPEELSRVHLTLAAANAAVGELERQAWHLAQAQIEPDESVAAVLEAAAQSIQRRGAPAEAAAAYEDAARLSADRLAGATRLISAAELWLGSGRTETARVMAEEVLALDPEGRLRGRAALVRGRALMVGTSEEEGRLYLLDEARAAAATDPAAAVAMAVSASGSALRGGLAAEAVEAARLATELSSRADAGARRMADLALTSVRVAGGESGLRARLVEMVEAQLAAPEALAAGSAGVALSAALALLQVEDHENTRRVLDHIETVARAGQLLGVVPAMLVTRALLEHRVCRWSRAEALAIEALDLIRQTGQEALSPYAAAVLAIADAVLGNAGRCRERCLFLLDSPAARIPVVSNGVLAALGLMELGQGRYEEAVRWYEILSGIAGSAAPVQPGIVMWGADLAEAYLSAGHPGKAAMVARQLQEQAQATGSARVAAAAKRVRAMLCTDVAEADHLFAEALRHYGGQDWRFARARVTLARGLLLSRAGRSVEGEARLRQSLELFEEMGARPWAARVEEELARLGAIGSGRANRVAELTPLERQVAMAAAMGGTPPDIAAGLFLGEATVAAALASAANRLGLDRADDFSGLVSELALGVWAGPSEGRTDGRGPTGDQGMTPAAQPIIRLLGGCQVVTSRATRECPGGPAGQLLDRVALAGRVPVEELVEELWPEAPPGAGRSRLRTVLSRMRSDFGPVVVRDGDWIALAPDVQVDVRLFEAVADAALAASSAQDPRAAQLAQNALQLYTGPLLPTSRYLDFTAGPRERLRRRHLSMVFLVVADAEARGDVEGAVALLEKVITDNPHEEGLYLKAASVLAEDGQVGAAMAMMHRAEAALSELGVALSARSQELVRRLNGR